MGMPTWDAIKDFNKPEFKGLEIIYATPFYHTKMDKISQAISNHFTTICMPGPVIWFFAVMKYLEIRESVAAIWKRYFFQSRQ